MKCISCGSNLLKSNSLLKCVRCGKEYTFEEIKVNLNGFKSNKSSEVTEKADKASLSTTSKQPIGTQQSSKEPTAAEKNEEFEKILENLKQLLKIKERDVPGTQSSIDEKRELQKQISDIKSDRKQLCALIPEAKSLLEKIDNLKMLEAKVLSVDEIEIPGVKEVDEQLKSVLKEGALDEKTKRLSVLKNTITIEKNKVRKNECADNVTKVRRDIKSVEIQLTTLSFFKFLKKRKLQEEKEGLEKKLTACIKLSEEFNNAQNKKIIKLTNEYNALQKDVDDISRQADLLKGKKEQLINDYRKQYVSEIKSLSYEFETLKFDFIKKYEDRIKKLDDKIKSIVSNYKDNIMLQIKQTKLERAHWKLKRMVKYNQKEKIKYLIENIQSLNLWLTGLFRAEGDIYSTDSTKIIGNLLQGIAVVACECDAPLNRTERNFVDLFIKEVWTTSISVTEWAIFGQSSKVSKELIDLFNSFKTTINRKSNEKASVCAKLVATVLMRIFACFLICDNEISDIKCETLVYYTSLFEGGDNEWMKSYWEN